MTVTNTKTNLSKEIYAGDYTPKELCEIIQFYKAHSDFDVSVHTI